MEGVAADPASLDELITGAAEGWTAERLAPLERNILRVAVHELLDWPDIPAAVSINEAVDLAKRYCQTEAAGLVNGILGRIAAEQRGGLVSADRPVAGPAEELAALERRPRAWRRSRACIARGRRRPRRAARAGRRGARPRRRDHRAAAARPAAPPRRRRSRPALTSSSTRGSRWWCCPPSDPDAAGHAELQGIGSGDDRPPMDELADRGWLTQGAAVRGAELETLGLSIYAGHPELSLVNLPTAFIESGVRLLKELGTYVLSGGRARGRATSCSCAQTCRTSWAWSSAAAPRTPR